MSFMLIFFFQAEDGIRDLIVTGVQTCALPISHCKQKSACREGCDEICEPPGISRKNVGGDEGSCEASKPEEGVGEVYHRRPVLLIHLACEIVGSGHNRYTAKTERTDRSHQTVRA